MRAEQVTSITVRLGIAALAGLIVALIIATRGCSGQGPDLLLLDRQNITGNLTRNCITRLITARCPDRLLHFYLYSGKSGEAEEVDLLDPGWLARSRFNTDLPVVILIHGYRGGDSLMPMVILKNEYIRRGEHNVFTVDWGELSKTPCYVQAVNSLKHVARCAVQLLYFLEDARVPTEEITCVGHSLGAHVCGIMARHAPKHLARIVGLDPARPLFQYTPHTDRLDPRDATVVQIIHTNTGFYGLSHSHGTVDFCINNGNQPFCAYTRNEQLCSHMEAVCYMAESLDPSRVRTGLACHSTCPQTTSGPANVAGRQTKARLGEYLQTSASGMYCLGSDKPPFCPQSYNDTSELYGDLRCCPVYTRQSGGPPAPEQPFDGDFEMLPTENEPQ